MIIESSNVRLSADRIFATDSIDGNHTFGSLAAFRRSPRAIAIVRLLISSRLPIPILSVLII